MLPNSLFKDQELIEQILDTSSNNPLLKKANIAPSKIRDYLKTAIDEGPDVADRSLSLEERIIVEAIIEEEGRPAILIQNNQFQIPNLQFWKDRLEPNRSTIEKFITSVGRIEVTDHPRGFAYLGTGWLVTDDIIVTNRHIAEAFAFQSNGKFVFQQNPFTARTIDVSIDFREEYRIDTEEEFEINEVLYIEGQPGLDIAFLKVKFDGLNTRYPILLASQLPEDESEIAVIGYPAEDSQRNPLESSKIRAIFADIYDVKRLQPGFVKSVIDGNPVFTHDSSTLGGNSGSVVLDFRTGKAVGLHFGGRYKVENYAVPAHIVSQRLDALLSGTLETIRIGLSLGNQADIETETVDNETPIEFEDHICEAPIEEGIDDTLEALPFPAVNVQLPKTGQGYYSYSAHREKQFGLAETIRAIENIASAWFNNHRTGPVIGIGNISVKGGGPVPPHTSHQKGLDVDFRLLRTDGARVGVRYQDPAYSRHRTQKLVNTIRSNPILRVEQILCNDSGLTGVEPWPGHDDHLHVRFKT